MAKIKEKNAVTESGLRNGKQQKTRSAKGRGNWPTKGLMDGFVLPPFESTCILKDNDIISVNKKGGHFAIEGNNGPNVVENLQIVEKQTVTGGPLLLTNEVFGHGSRGYESEASEDDSEKEDEVEPKEDTSHQKNALGGNAVSKKRKGPERLPNSKKKKHRHDCVEKLDEQTKKQLDLIPSNKDVENSKGSAESSGDYQIKHVTKKKKKHRDDAVEKLDEQTKKQQDLTPNNKDMENNKGSAESSEVNHITHVTKKNDELQKSGVEDIEATSKSDTTKKKDPSRSARRKANKRRWLQKVAKIKEKMPLLNWKDWKKKQWYDAVEKLDEQTKKQQDLTPNNKDIKNNKGSAESSEDDHSTHVTKKNDELQKSGVEDIEATSESDATKKKGPSRSARRRANKRWWQELAEFIWKNAIAESEGLDVNKRMMNQGRATGTMTTLDPSSLEE